MWAVIKINTKNLGILKKEFYDKLGKDVKFYIPKMKIKKFVKTKICMRENLLLGDYMLCFHKDFTKRSVLNSLKYCRGLKYFLSDLINYQIEIEKFISKCKENEDESGFIKPTFFEFEDKKNYEFISGPFTDMIFKVIRENKFSLKALMGKYEVNISKKENLFRPI